jgi:hypothetical protein
MTLEDIWRQRSDEELIAAAAQLTDYAEDAQSVIQAAIRKRGLSTDSRRAMENGPKRKRRPRFFRGPINSIDHADYIIRSASQFFYALAAIQMLIIVVLLGGVLGRIQSFRGTNRCGGVCFGWILSVEDKKVWGGYISDFLDGSCLHFNLGCSHADEWWGWEHRARSPRLVECSPWI